MSIPTQVNHQVVVSFSISFLQPPYPTSSKSSLSLSKRMYSISKDRSIVFLYLKEISRCESLNKGRKKRGRRGEITK